LKTARSEKRPPRENFTGEPQNPRADQIYDFIGRAASKDNRKYGFQYLLEAPGTLIQ